MNKLRLTSLANSKLQFVLEASVRNEPDCTLIASLISKELQTLRPSAYQTLTILKDLIWEKLNTGHWKDVPRPWRDLYSLTSIHMIRVICEASSDSNHAVLKDCIGLCDMGLLLGSPVCDDILSIWASEIHDFIAKGSFEAAAKRQKLISPKLQLKEKEAEYLRPSITRIQVLEDIDLGTFLEKYKALGVPFIIRGLIDDWPAREKWSVEYLRYRAGYRRVPIEIGSRYTDGNWTQRLMTLNAFIEDYLENKNSREIGYLAQHNLLDQVSSLREDIDVPELCLSGEEPGEDLNFWFGPKGTVSPLHTDPKHNVLTQVLGFKYVRLYDARQSEYLYPYSEEDLMSNTSQVDVENPDLKEFPEFKNARGLEGILGPGDGLYIPPKMWHFVKSLSLSISISFWF